MELYLAVIAVLGLGNVVLAWLYMTKGKPKVRKDLEVILQALRDFEERNGTLVEIRRVHPDEVFIWNRR